MNAREAALSTLLKTAQSRGYSNIELDTAIKKFELCGVERSFFTALFYGVIERKITLDYYIPLLSSRRIDEIDIKVLTILEMGIYQLNFMDKVPESAAVNEAVKLCERFYAPKNSGAFVNAILRSFIRQKDTLALPDKKKDEIRYLSVAYSVPEWICKLWRDEFGKSCEHLLASLSHSPRMTLRANTLKISSSELAKRLCDNGIPAKVTPIAPHGVKLESTISTEELGIDSGDFFVQDEASQICVAALGAREGDTIIDCCACPGGKSVGAAMDMNNKGSILSLDLHKNKLGLISGAAERLGISIIKTDVQNGAKERDDMPCADKIICDVPCSGLGVISKKPDIRYKKPEDVEHLPSLQLSILKTNAKYLRSGGDLIYSTCTLRRAENEDVVTSFLKENTDFSLAPFDVGELHSDGMCVLLPQIHKTDGFFIAKLHKN